MPVSKPATPGRKLVPAAAEPSSARPGRVRLAKVLAATPTARVSGMTTPADKPKRTKAKKPKPASHRYKLPDEEHARLVALKQRLEALGIPAKKNALLRAGVLLLATLSDEQLKTAVAATG